MIFYREIETKMRKLRKKMEVLEKWSDPNLKELIPIRIISKVDFYINDTYYYEKLIWISRRGTDNFTAKHQFITAKLLFIPT